MLPLRFLMQNLSTSLTHPSLYILCHIYRSCIIGPELSVKVCSIGTVINRSAYASDYCQLEGTTGRQTQPMPIRWMAWESVLLVCTHARLIKLYSPTYPTKSNKFELSLTNAPCSQYVLLFLLFSVLLCSFTA